MPLPHDNQQQQNQIMKTHIMALAAAILTTIPLQAGDGHDHTKKEAGPNGGRLITSVEPHAEFLVTSDRKVQITFVGEDGKPVAPSGQVVAVTTGERSAPVKMTFTKSDVALVSEQTVPEGNNFPVVVQIKSTPTTPMVTAKFTLDLSVCGECKHAEYACTCAH
jgi:hypothetical protein